MSEYSLGLTFIRRAVLGIDAVCGNRLTRRMGDFLPVARIRERLVDLAREIGSANVNEMLMAIPGGSTANPSNAADVPVQNLSPKLLSPFGDW
jgi:hypothetical protein